MYFLEVAKAKSRTLFALNTHVFVPVALPFSVFSASSWVTISTGLSKEVLAFSKRFL
jgi:hypothetical protein